MSTTRNYARWIVIDGENPLVVALELCLKLGVGVYFAGKPGMVAWYGLGVQCSAALMGELERGCKARGVKLIRRQPRGAWDVPVREVMSPGEIRDFLAGEPRR